MCRETRVFNNYVNHKMLETSKPLFLLVMNRESGFSLSLWGAFEGFLHENGVFMAVFEWKFADE